MSEDNKEERIDQEHEENKEPVVENHTHNHTEKHTHISVIPLAIGGVVIALIFSFGDFLKTNRAKRAEKQEQMIPWGKSYEATGAVIICEPFQQSSVRVYGYEYTAPYRVLFRTPDDNVFEIPFRSGNQPPGFANAIGNLGYHQCGEEGGREVYCFDHFKFLHQGGVKQLDLNGNPIETPAPGVKK